MVGMEVEGDYNAVGSAKLIIEGKLVTGQSRSDPHVRLVRVKASGRMSPPKPVKTLFGGQMRANGTIAGGRLGMKDAIRKSFNRAMSPACTAASCWPRAT